MKVQLENENRFLWTKWIYSLGCHWTLISPNLLKAEQYSINYCTEMDGLYEGFSAPLHQRASQHILFNHICWPPLCEVLGGPSSDWNCWKGLSGTFCVSNSACQYISWITKFTLGLARLQLASLSQASSTSLLATSVPTLEPKILTCPEAQKWSCGHEIWFSMESY